MKNRFPSFSQWKQTFKVLKKKEKITLGIFVLLAVASLLFLVTNFYFNHTKIVPALGGTYTEGIVGQPRFINPIYGETNDIDRTLIDLVFSGLMTYDNQGSIVPDLASDVKISDDGKTYDFTLKNNTFWHDNEVLSADDIVFTIKTIQNSDYKSPLRANWIDVDVEKTSERSVRFRLKTPYNAFLENCTVKIIPKHIWQEILPENFSLSSYNLKPVGSGVFTFVDLNQNNTGFIENINLTSNRKYYNSPSFISNFNIRFFEKKDDLLTAINAKQIDGFTLSAFDNNEVLAEKEVKQSWFKGERFTSYSFALPRYFAVFFNNQKNSLFADVNLRKALSYAVDKTTLTEKITGETKNPVTIVNSPILSDFFGYAEPSTTYDTDLEKAKSLLDKAGFKDNGQGVREKAIAKTPAFQFASYLKIGSKGKEVTQLQACLNKLSPETFGAILKDETNGSFGKATDIAVTEFQKKYLPDTKPTGETGAGTRKKLNELCLTQTPNTKPLKFTLVTINQPELVQVANELKNSWASVGVSVDINAVSLTDLKPIIKSRNYDALLYGQALGFSVDLYPFWHSSQKIDPGLNLSSYENKDLDKVLKEARETIDADIKKQKLEQAQNIITNDAPALFLYNPNYGYWATNKVKGISQETNKNINIIDPAKRFSNINSWYLKTKRSWTTI